jgi:hypothetical protein
MEMFIGAAMQEEPFRAAEIKALSISLDKDKARRFISVYIGTYLLSYFCSSYFN